MIFLKSFNAINLSATWYNQALNHPKMGDSVAIHYTAYLLDGTMIDNSYNRGLPIHFVLGGEQVIPGFEQVLPSMSKGQKSKVTVPPEIAYGDVGYPPIIPPNATIVYELELLSFTSIGSTTEFLNMKGNSNFDHLSWSSSLLTNAATAREIGKKEALPVLYYSFQPTHHRFHHICACGWYFRNCGRWCFSPCFLDLIHRWPDVLDRVDHSLNIWETWDAK